MLEKLVSYQQHGHHLAPQAATIIIQTAVVQCRQNNYDRRHREPNQMSHAEALKAKPLRDDLTRIQKVFHPYPSFLFSISAFFC